MNSSWIYTPSTGVAEKTVVVAGLPRCGSSAVSGLLHHLGVPMGREWLRDSTDSYVTYENRDLCGAVAAEQWGVVRRTAARWNADHVIWGFKHWTVILHWRRLLSIVRNPHVVTVWRDVAAIMTKQIDIRHVRALAEWEAITSLYRQQVDMVSRMGTTPHLLISYERLMECPRRAAEELSGFVGVSPAVAQVADATAFVRRQPRQREREG